MSTGFTLELVDDKNRRLGKRYPVKLDLHGNIVGPKPLTFDVVPPRVQIFGIPLWRERKCVVVGLDLRHYGVFLGRIRLTVDELFIGPGKYTVTEFYGR